jgi:nucleoside-diphosphate-sugar epimerase
MISVFGPTGFIGSNFSALYKVNSIPKQSNTPVINTDVLYFISTTHNYHVFDKPFLDIDTNLIKLVSVLEEFKKNCPDNTFTFISSCFVYGDTEYPASEETVCNPKGFYSITKYAAEKLLISYCETFGLKYNILRLCNVYGENATGVSKKRNALQFMTSQIIKNQDVELYDNGENIRDFMHVEDVCRAIRLCMYNSQHRVVNIGSGVGHSFRPLMQYVKDKVGSTSKLVDINPPHFHKVVQVKDIYFDISKLKSLGFQPEISIHDGLDRIIKKEVTQ